MRGTETPIGGNDPPKFSHSDFGDSAGKDLPSWASPMMVCAQRDGGASLKRLLHGSLATGERTRREHRWKESRAGRGVGRGIYSRELCKFRSRFARRYYLRNRAVHRMERDIRGRWRSDNPT